MTQVNQPGGREGDGGGGDCLEDFLCEANKLKIKGLGRNQAEFFVPENSFKLDESVDVPGHLIKPEEFLDLPNKFKINSLGQNLEEFSVPGYSVKQNSSVCENFSEEEKFEASFELDVYPQEQENSFESTITKTVDELACDQCSFIGKYPMALKRHKNRTHESAYSCDQCSFKGSDKYTLLRHRRNVHLL